MELKIEYLPIKALKPYEKNTRKHTDYDVGEIAKSITECGFNDPIGIYGNNNLIVEGHGRLLAAKSLGMKEVPCIRLDHMTDEQRRKYAILHNKTAELSTFDFDNLALELEDLDFSNFSFDFGIDDEEEETDAYETVETSERELEPYKYIHYLVTIETNEHDRYVEIMKTIEEMGATVKMTRNDT